MTTFRYRLEPLLEQKRAALEEARRMLGERLGQWRDETQRLEQLQSEAAAAKEKADTARSERYASSGPLSAEALQQRVEAARWLEKEAGWARDRVIEQRIAVEDAQDEVEQARRDLTEASRQVEVLETHRARQEQRFRKEQERLEGIAMDEAGNAQFLKRSRE